MGINIFPKLPVLQYFCDKGNKNLSHFVVVAVQHILETTGSLFEALIDLGVSPENIYLLGKSYSTHQETAQKLMQKGIHLIPNSTQEKIGKFRDCFEKDIVSLWQMASEKCLNENQDVLILDEGGRCTFNIPEAMCKRHNVISVEQTTAGYRRLKDNCFVPIINVATSAVKVGIEPNLIAEKVLNSIEQFCKFDPSKKYGIIGFGNVGKKVFEVLCSKNASVFVYDVIPAYCLKDFCSGKGIFLENLQDIFLKCDVLFGCSGVDFSKDVNYQDLKGEKTLISCSSEDIEFQSIIKHYPLESFSHKELFCELKIQDDLKKLCVLNGGFPINFDRSFQSVERNKIQLIRGLLVGGLLQAAKMIENGNTERKIYKLDAEVQKNAVDVWLKNHPDYARYVDSVENFGLVEWIEENSVGNL